MTETKEGKINIQIDDEINHTIRRKNIAHRIFQKKIKKNGAKKNKRMKKGYNVNSS